MRIDEMARFDGQGRLFLRTRTPAEFLADFVPPPLAVPDVDRAQNLLAPSKPLVLGPRPVEPVRASTLFGEVFVPSPGSDPTTQTSPEPGTGPAAVTGGHGPDCCCMCCCCEEAEVPVLYHPGDECELCQVSEPLTLGVFIDGQSATSTPEEWQEHKRNSGIRDLCAKYPHEKWFYVGWWSPGATIDLAEEIADRLKEEICKRSWWDRSARVWRSCHPVTIDLFGYSRGAATAVLIARELNRKWSCEKCPEATPRGPAHVRFLGIIDPYGSWVAGTRDLPGNVRFFYSAYSDRNRAWTQVASAWDSEHFDRTERNVDAGNMFPLEHDKMDDKESDPVKKLRASYKHMTQEAFA
ncbi:MAG: hypothetical protein EPO30_11980, partial [Lysobacteraceae bacterium]